MLNNKKVIKIFNTCLMVIGLSLSSASYAIDCICFVKEQNGHLKCFPIAPPPSDIQQCTRLCSKTTIKDAEMAYAFPTMAEGQKHRDLLH
jgi:hypothetical protein